MILVNDAPKVLYAHESHAHLGQCDCDCACVLDVPSAVPVEAGPGLWARQSPVYPALLPDGWRVIYNPAGPAGVVVLNGPAAALLDRFDHPARLDHAAAPAGSPPAAAVEAAELMARTGLLRPLLGYQAADLADSRP